ncbi:hypothetical protein GCM10010174_61270 [Kutzneria viridogrisea]|uniref:Uncharacterized protein n=1 Tax=Kutzneria viridogrisea TaxID=47990 RepID=A0ABR6BGF1_9PSEU|nr:hypothetical protein [Kutzneria viridogrisea]
MTRLRHLHRVEWKLGYPVEDEHDCDPVDPVAWWWFRPKFVRGEDLVYHLARGSVDRPPAATAEHTCACKLRRTRPHPCALTALREVLPACALCLVAARLFKSLGIRVIKAQDLI